VILPISASQVARITGMSHQSPTLFLIVKVTLERNIPFGQEYLIYKRLNTNIIII
jgi:hypothetical protein